MSSLTLEQIYRKQIDAWKRILADSEIIDPDDDGCDWYDLCYGFFLAVTQDYKAANELAEYCYDNHLM